MRISKVLLVFFLVLLSAVKGQVDSVFTERDSSQIDSLKSLMGLPVAYYTPETRLAFGIGVVNIYNTEKDSIQDSTFNSMRKLKALYTLNNQYDLELEADIYTPYNDFHINQMFQLTYYPLPFYGVGNQVTDSFDNYSARMLTQNFKAIRQLKNGWFIGLQEQFKYTNIVERNSLGLLNDGVVGSEGGITSGVGFVLRYDSRDNVNSTLSGKYFHVDWVHFSKWIVSDFLFDHYKIDWRQFKTNKKNWTLAYQIMGEFNSGNVPFYKLGMLGGYQKMRGYFHGKYRDKNYAVAQVELRKQLNKYMSYVLFVSSGNVFPDLAAFDIEDVKTTFGGGIRLFPPDLGRLSLRVDYAKSFVGHAWYVTLGEAF